MNAILTTLAVIIAVCVTVGYGLVMVFLVGVMRDATRLRWDAGKVYRCVDWLDFCFGLFIACVVTTFYCLGAFGVLAVFAQGA